MDIYIIVGFFVFVVFVLFNKLIDAYICNEIVVISGILFEF